MARPGAPLLTIMPARNSFDANPRVALHLESDFGVTEISGKVSEWAGREGYRNAVVQAVDTKRPALVPNVLDGKPAIRFTAAQQQLLVSGTQIGVAAGDLVDLYVVGSVNTVATNFTTVLFSYGTIVGGAGDSFNLSHYITEWQANVMRMPSVGLNPKITSATGINSVPTLYAMRNDPTTATFTINNNLGNTVGGASGGLKNRPDMIGAGSYTEGAYWLYGDLFNVVVLTNATHELRQFVLNYLAAKYPSVPIATTPATILGSLLHADFDAADPSIVLNAGKVASIPNRGNDSAPMVQGTAAAQPTFGASSFAGGPGMSFDGVDDRLLCTLTTPLAIGKRPYMWVIFKALDTAIVDRIDVSIFGGGGYMTARSSFSGSAYFGSQLAPGVAAGTLFQVAASDLNPHLMEVGFTVGGTAANVFDGVSNNMSATSSIPLEVAFNQICLGTYGNAPAYCRNTMIRRIIVANDMPSPAQISAMRTYLRAQPYGLTF